MMIIRSILNVDVDICIRMDRISIGHTYEMNQQRRRRRWKTNRRNRRESNRRNHRRGRCRSNIGHHRLIQPEKLDIARFFLYIHIMFAFSFHISHFCLIFSHSVRRIIRLTCIRCRRFFNVSISFQSRISFGHFFLLLLFLGRLRRRRFRLSSLRCVPLFKCMRQLIFQTTSFHIIINVDDMKDHLELSVVCLVCISRILTRSSFAVFLTRSMLVVIVFKSKRDSTRYTRNEKAKQRFFVVVSLRFFFLSFFFFFSSVKRTLSRALSLAYVCRVLACSWVD